MIHTEKEYQRAIKQVEATEKGTANQRTELLKKDMSADQIKRLLDPGLSLLEDMKDEGISINGLAQAIRVPANRISLIVNGKRGISADTAARLGRYFGTSPQYWLNIQNRFDLDSLDKAVIERDVIPKKAA